MITVTDLSLSYSGTPLFSHVDLQFLRGNCYGIIGANGAGKSTFLKILSGDLDSTSGEVSILPNTRMSVLKQDQNAYDAYNVMDTVIMGNQRLYDIGKQKEALYAKEEMTDEDGMLACQLEEEYAELGGWEAESDASRILQGLGIGTELHYNDMATLDARLKVKVLDKVSFIVGHGDKIAFVGDNENAHTALFKILAGEMEPDEGTVKWGQTATFSYFPKDNTPYFLDNEDNLVQWLRQFSPDPQEQYLRGFLGRMLFSGDEVYKPVKVLSGGEKVRCMLSRMMLSGANVLMLDQPTNHLDLESIAALNKGLEAVKCNVLVASHDHQLIQTVCNRVFDFSTDGKLTDRRMTYDEYLEKQKEAE